MLALPVQPSPLDGHLPKIMLAARPALSTLKLSFVASGMTIQRRGALRAWLPELIGKQTGHEQHIHWRAVLDPCPSFSPFFLETESPVKRGCHQIVRMDTKLDAQEAARICGCDSIGEQLPANSPPPETGHNAHAQLAHMAFVPTVSPNNVAPANHLSLILDRHELRVLVLYVLPYEGRNSFDGWGCIAAQET